MAPPFFCLRQLFLLLFVVLELCFGKLDGCFLSGEFASQVVDEFLEREVVHGGPPCEVYM